MHHIPAATRLANNARTIRGLFEGCDDEQLHWRPADTSWNLLEVINHLADEELLDFRTRLDLTLHAPGTAWPLIDPPSWITERHYAEHDPIKSLQRFLQEREHSIAWLKHLDAPDWTLAYEHPVIGTMTAYDVLTSWLAHDLIHIRQMLRLQYGWLKHSNPDARTDYAGNW